MKMAWLCAAYAASMVFFTDYVASGPIGPIISMLVCVGVVFLAVLNYRVGAFLALVVLMTFPSFPRDILDQYALVIQEGSEIAFASPKFSVVAGFSLAIWMVLALGGIAGLRLCHAGFRIASGEFQAVLLAMCSMVVVMLLGAFLSVLDGEVLAFRETVSDLRFPLLCLVGALIAWAWFDSLKGDRQVLMQDAFMLLLVVILVSGLKTLFFLFDDYVTGVFRLSFGNPAVFVWSAVLAAVWMGAAGDFRRWPYAILLGLGLAGSLPDGRGPIIVGAFTVIFLIFMAYWYRPVQVPSLLGRLGILGLAIVVMLVAIVSSNERLRGFLTYKSDFLSRAFYKELSHSPAVRIAEFRNIVATHAETGIGLVVGRGAGGSFDYERYPLGEPLDITDYSSRELETGRFYRPHTFINFWLLKGGLLGLAIYVAFIGWCGRKAWVSLQTCNDSAAHFVGRFLVLSVPTAMVQVFWQPDLLIAFVVLAMLLILSSHEKPGLAG